MTSSFADIEEDWVHKPTPVKAVVFRGFGRGGNGDRVVAWFQHHNVSVERFGDDRLLIDNGTDDLPTQIVIGDAGIYDPAQDSVHRVKGHMSADLYEPAQAVTS